MSTITVRIPDSMHVTAKQLAHEDHVSLNQFISTAVAEKVSALLTLEYIEARAKRGNREEFEQVLAKVPNANPVENDQ